MPVNLGLAINAGQRNLSCSLTADERILVFACDGKLCISRRGSIHERFEQAEFYAEVEGHPEQRSLQLAFEELGFFSEEFKPLGTFPANPFRRKGWEAPTRPGT